MKTIKIFMLMLLFLPMANAGLPQDFHEIQRVGNESEWKIVVIGGFPRVPLNDVYSDDTLKSIYKYNLDFFSDVFKYVSTLGQSDDTVLLENFDSSLNPMPPEELKSLFSLPLPEIDALESLKPGILVGGWDPATTAQEQISLLQKMSNDWKAEDQINNPLQSFMKYITVTEYRSNLLINSAINALKENRRVFVNATINYTLNSSVLTYLQESKIPHLVVSTTADWQPRSLEEIARESLIDMTKDKTHLAKNNNWSFNADEFSQLLSETRKTSLEYLLNSGLTKEQLSPQQAIK